MIRSVNYHTLPIIKFVFLLLFSSPLFAHDVTDNLERTLQVSLSYHLDVEGKRSTIVNITSLLPQSITGKQEISNITFSPEPENTFSKFGNQYAQWRLTGKSIKNVIEIRFEAKIFRQILDKKSTHEKLTKQEYLKYLKREKYLDVGSKIIKQAQNAIKRKSIDIEQVEQILKFVTKNMKPTRASREMLGAAKAIKKGKGDCTEYTDIFVTLCRQFNLPAKHMSGYIITDNGSIGHSWAEVYTKEKGWIIVDPLHMDQKLGKFEKLNNKYLAFSSVRNDSELGKGMLYAWNVNQAKKAQIVPRLIAVDK